MNSDLPANQRLRVPLIVRESAMEAIEFRQEITFGPGVATRSRVRAAAVVHDTIRSVSLIGDPGFSTAGGPNRQSRLQPGDRFEFRRWLRDRDRIVQYYWDRQYYTARVVPRCAPRPRPQARSVPSISNTASLVDDARCSTSRGTWRTMVSSLVCGGRGRTMSCSTC